MSQAFKVKPKQPEVGKRPEHKWNNRILVVEDEREIGRLYNEILSSPPSTVVPLRSSRQAPQVNNAVPKSTPPGAEFSVTVVHSPEEAMAQVKHAMQKNEPFAMGFFDVLLGAKQDGIELVRELHKLDPLLYAVFVTAYQDRSVDAIKGVLDIAKNAHWDYLSKPFSAGEILQKARNFISLWNLSREREIREDLLAEAHRRLLEYERSSSVAAVARGVSHEFGNILMQIMGKADLARKKNEKDMRESLELILESSHRASEILDRFKHLANPAEMQNPKAPVSVCALVDEAIDLMEHGLRTNNVKACKIKMDPVEVVGNATSLLQVLVNLTINSIHAMEHGGQIDYSVMAVSDGAEIRVRDYGPGVKPELLEKVFEPFFTTKGEKGTGLGLAICREIVEIEHRGQLTLQNHGVKGLEVVIRIGKGGDDETA
ncbi:MAG: ATP-binding protein [Bdellovibrionales bacterium]